MITQVLRPEHRSALRRLDAINDLRSGLVTAEQARALGKGIIAFFRPLTENDGLDADRAAFTVAMDALAEVCPHPEVYFLGSEGNEVWHCNVCDGEEVA